MSNSSLVKYKKLSPYHSGKKEHNISRITIHCIVGQWTAKQAADFFYVRPAGRECSCNYAVGTDGISLVVDESNRSWCSSSSDNDSRAITIETASDTFHPYAVRDNVYKNLLELVYDICKRNGKDTLLWFGDKEKTLNYKPKSNEMVLTVHRWFDDKSCPGDWLYSRHGEIARITTERLQADKKGGCEEMGCPYWKNGKCTKGQKPSTNKSIKEGDLVKITGSKWYTGQSIPRWVKSQKWYVVEISGNRVVLGKNQNKTNDIQSPINLKDIERA